MKPKAYHDARGWNDFLCILDSSCCYFLSGAISRGITRHCNKENASKSWRRLCHSWMTPTLIQKNLIAQTRSEINAYACTHPSPVTSACAVLFPFLSSRSVHLWNCMGETTRTIFVTIFRRCSRKPSNFLSDKLKITMARKKRIWASRKVFWIRMQAVHSIL